jgi:ABC-type multidrug transport system fused ATPase/permease subunit
LCTQQFVAEDYESTRYHNAVAEAHQKAVDTAHMQAQLEAGAHVAGNAAVLGVLGYGGTLVLAGSISAGDLTGFVMYSLLLAGNLSSLTSVYSEMARSVAASNRVFSILDRQPQITSSAALERTADGANKDPLAQLDYSPVSVADMPVKKAMTIQIKGLNFRYPSRPDFEVLKDFGLNVQAGEVVALVGQSGSGKSTIAVLLTRLYEANDNAIRIDGRPITEYDPAVLRRMIAVVSQDPVLLQGTIRDNIRYGSWESVSEEQVEQAAKLAHVLDFTKDFPDGLDTLVGPRGTHLSGGQRQRIALARALAKNSPIIILDEATSALDARAEHKVQMAMHSICQESGRTILSIAHRLSTIRHASRIAVVQEGRIVQTGTFEELKSTDGPFRELMKTQLVGGH